MEVDRTPAFVEYRVRPTTRYIITRFERGPTSEGGNCWGGSSTRGEYDCANTAFHVATALCKLEHEKLGFPPGDERIQYPREVSAGE